MKAAAFFDLDRTLVAANTGWLYAKWEARHGRISRLQLARAGGWLAMYHFGWIDMPRAYRAALTHYRGVHGDIIARRTRDWFDAEVRDALLPDAAQAIARHRAEGHPVVLLSNTSNYQAALAADAWSLDGWLANRFTTDEHGALDGDFEPPLAYGHGKVERATAWAAQHDVDLDRSWFYSDSISDLPMLDRVGHPIVVQPDPRLARIAKRRSWPILDWTTTA
jgi:HAD superfamily hydrolase (TIGR01490 family)